MIVYSKNIRSVFLFLLTDWIGWQKYSWTRCRVDGTVIRQITTLKQRFDSKKQVGRDGQSSIRKK
ncbi:MAG: hypothetical protein DWQ10_16325 [Calditrichaeota bacterium]|nr:MAG: hypothetical protein DWQ10_16325 [Calditrichota bacterium]